MISPPPKVSVIIATYNKASALRYAIDSVLWQTFSDYELWVIGDACTDESEQLVTSYGDPRVFWHNLPQNSGYQSAPNNEGLRRARGKYVAYLALDIKADGVFKMANVYDYDMVDFTVTP